MVKSRGSCPSCVHGTHRIQCAALHQLQAMALRCSRGCRDQAATALHHHPSLLQLLLLNWWLLMLMLCWVGLNWWLLLLCCIGCVVLWGSSCPHEGCMRLRGCEGARSWVCIRRGAARCIMHVMCVVGPMHPWIRSVLTGQMSVMYCSCRSVSPATPDHALKHYSTTALQAKPCHSLACELQKPRRMSNAPTKKLAHIQPVAALLPLLAPCCTLLPCGSSVRCSHSSHLYLAPYSMKSRAQLLPTHVLYVPVMGCHMPSS